MGIFDFLGGIIHFFFPRDSSRIHYVHPHWVTSYTRKDGTYVQGYNRGGKEGYFAHNPGALMYLIKKWW